MQNKNPWLLALVSMLILVLVLALAGEVAAPETPFFSRWFWFTVGGMFVLGSTWGSRFDLLELTFWLLVTPIVVLVVVGLSLEPLVPQFVNDISLAVAMFLLIIGSWVYASLYYEPEMVKVALAIGNTIMRSVLALSVVVVFVNDSSLSPSVSDAALTGGLTPKTVIDMLIKIITLPYVLAGLWAAMALELRLYRLKKRQLETSRVA